MVGKWGCGRVIKYGVLTQRGGKYDGGNRGSGKGEN